MQSTSVHERVVHYSCTEVTDFYRDFQVPSSGLSAKEANHQRAQYGSNFDYGSTKDSVLVRLRHAFINPFSIVLFTIAAISFLTDVIFSSSANHNIMTVSIVCAMLLLSGCIRFIQEMKAKHVSDNLIELIRVKSYVKRNGMWEQIDAGSIVVGDLVRVHAGSRVPADMRVTLVKNCLVSQSAITGESSVETKTTRALDQQPHSIQDFKNIAFKGTTITSGYLEGVVLAVGADTVFGELCPEDAISESSFNKGANSIAWVLIRFMIALVPLVFIVSGITQGSWLSSLLFSLSVAVGLTPELLPMVITACLARGSSLMGRKQTVVKDINAMQVFGSMDVLCTDKTGTLTQDELTLEYYLDILGNEDNEVLDLAYLNSHFQGGATNHVDRAILNAGNHIVTAQHFKNLVYGFTSVSVQPFDYDRLISSVVLQHRDKRYVICKGEVNAVLSRCSRIKFRNEAFALGEDADASMHAVVDEMLNDGMKVLAVAVKELSPDEIRAADVANPTSSAASDICEDNFTLIGYIGFFDAPKEFALESLTKLRASNVGIKVLTGDNVLTSTSVCRRLGMNERLVITGSELEKLSDDEMRLTIEKCEVFAELTPSQKAHIVRILQENGHIVGYLGDGINDLPAIVQSDVGISVDNALPTIKEAADVVLLKKDLGVLEEGIMEGRRSFANMLKYIKITASSNLGNIIAIVFASVFLPFFPMTSVQILLLNLLYDTLCLALPWDTVDEESIMRPLDWSGNTLSRFMVSFGPLSSVFDLIMFAFLYFVLCPIMAGGSFFDLPDDSRLYFIALFQTGWFLESMWSQVLILHLLRTNNLTFWKSKPSRIVIVVTLTGIVCFTLLAMLPPGHLLGLTQLPLMYFVFLACVVCCYFLSVSVMKYWYIRRFGRLV